ncbi:hypothetical protein Aduo_003240 [Ancylostoma duodenale]
MYTSCTPDFTIGVAYVKNPPPDESNYCQFESKRDSNKLSCRRRGYLLYDREWIRVTLSNFEYLRLPYKQAKIVKCLRKLLHILHIPEWPKMKFGATNNSEQRPSGAFVGGAGHGAKKEADLSKDPNFTPLMFMLTPLIVLKIVLFVLLILTIRCLKNSYKPPKKSLAGKSTAVPPPAVPATAYTSPSTVTRKPKQSTILVDLWDAPKKPENKTESASKESVQRVNAKVEK